MKLLSSSLKAALLLSIVTFAVNATEVPTNSSVPANSSTATTGVTTPVAKAPWCSSSWKHVCLWKKSYGAAALITAIVLIAAIYNKCASKTEDVASATEELN